MGIRSHDMGIRLHACIILYIYSDIPFKGPDYFFTMKTEAD